jgi:hypothetical protein
MIRIVVLLSQVPESERTPGPRPDRRRPPEPDRRLPTGRRRTLSPGGPGQPAGAAGTSGRSDMKQCRRCCRWHSLLSLAASAVDAVAAVAECNRLVKRARVDLFCIVPFLFFWLYQPLRDPGFYRNCRKKFPKLHYGSGFSGMCPNPQRTSTGFQRASTEIAGFAV